jgi:DNA-binding response OmpR family regulator
MPLHILIADSDRELAEAVGWYLEAEGLRVTVVDDGSAALEILAGDPPHAAVLDLHIPSLDGSEIIRQFREIACLPVLVLAAKEVALEQIEALGLAADDYVVRPCGAMELVARLRALVGRANLTGKTPPHPSHLKLVAEDRAVLIHGEAIPLPAPEYDLLACLMHHPRIPLSRTQLADAIWGDDFYGDLRLVDSHIYTLRAKLRASGLKPMPIVTVRGIGYAYQPDER